jgi:hypothetical protein
MSTKKKQQIREEFFNKGHKGITVGGMFKAGVNTLVFIGCLAGLAITTAMFVFFLYIFAPFFY